VCHFLEPAAAAAAAAAASRDRQSQTDPVGGETSAFIDGSGNQALSAPSCRRQRRVDSGRIRPRTLIRRVTIFSLHRPAGAIGV